MFALLIALLLIYCSGQFTDDPCTMLHPLSFCRQSDPKPGFCSGDLTLSCHGAYDKVSVPFLRPATEAPVLTPRTELPFALMSGLPPIVLEKGSPLTPLARFFRAGGNYIDHFRSDFPHIRFRGIPAGIFEHAAQQLVASALAHPSGNYIWRIRKKIYYSKMFSECHTLLVSGLNYIYAAGPFSRRGIFANYIHYLHVWLSVVRIIGLPSLFSQASYVEILTGVAEFQPFFSGASKTFWTFEFPESRHLPNALILPIILPRNVDDVLIRISDFFNGQNITSDWLMTRAQTSHRFEPGTLTVTNLLRASLALELYQPSENYCETYRQFWMDAFAAMRPASRKQHTDYLMRLNLLQLFRICGNRYMDLAFRALTVLPALIPKTSGSQIEVDVCFSNGTFTSMDVAKRLSSMSTLNFVDNILLVCKEELLFTRFISAFVVNITSTDSLRQLPSYTDTLYFSSTESYLVSMKTLKGFGIAIALLMREGDPHRVLETALRDRVIPNYYLDSPAIRAGFCEVLNCGVIETIFANSEYPQLLSIIRDHTLLRDF